MKGSANVAGWIAGAVALMAGGGALAADFTLPGPADGGAGLLAGVGFGVGLATLAVGWLARLVQGPAPGE